MSSQLNLVVCVVFEEFIFSRLLKVMRIKLFTILLFKNGLKGRLVAHRLSICLRLREGSRRYGIEPHIRLLPYEPASSSPTPPACVPSLAGCLSLCRINQNKIFKKKKVKNWATQWPSHCTTGFLPQRHRHSEEKGHMHPDVHSSIVHNSQIMGRTEMPFNRWLD